MCSLTQGERRREAIKKLNFRICPIVPWAVFYAIDLKESLWPFQGLRLPHVVDDEFAVASPREIANQIILEQPQT